MSKTNKLDDAELADVAGADSDLQDADIRPAPIPGKSKGDGTNLDDPTQQPDVGGGLTDPNLR